MGSTCVCGAEELDVDAEARASAGAGGVDGAPRATSSRSTDRPGRCSSASCPSSPSPVVTYLEEGLDAALAARRRGRRRADPAVDRLLRHADRAPDADRAGQRRHRRGRRAGPPARAPRASGCAAPSTCSSATAGCSSSGSSSPTTTGERDAALAALLPLQREDFDGLLEAMDGLPTTIRLLDPPLHEFLPDRAELIGQGRARRAPRARRTTPRTSACSPRSTACTSPTRCSACAGCGWA